MGNLNRDDPRLPEEDVRDVAPGTCRTETLARMLDHRSIRRYADAPIPADALDVAFAAAQAASTSSNAQCWSVVAVRDKDMQARIAQLADAQRHVADCPLLLVWLADLGRANRVAEARTQELSALDYLDTFLVATIDCAIAAQNAAVALEAAGLGICYIGGIRNDAERVAALLHLPPLTLPLFGMTVGVPDAAAARPFKPRLPTSNVLHHERYSVEGEAQSIQAYDDRIIEYFSAQGAAHAPWSEQLCARLGPVASLRGRDGLKAAVSAMGFLLK